ncbi:MAG: hypothetical protein LBE36_00765 [Flavobacteriaceae bacterium]|jgi:hypothetical protein|nr:hypothetical protein [Flavobacteriaceae bacterium]
MASLSDYLPYAFALVIAIPFLVLLRQFVYTYISLKEKEMKFFGIKESMDLRFQAFERMTLFLERMKPSNLVGKFDKNLSPHEFIFLAEKNIQEEFEYNASLQIYISKANWLNIVNNKDKIIRLLHSTYENLKSNANLQDFKTVFLMNYMNEGDYFSGTIDELKREMLLLENI